MTRSPRPSLVRITGWVENYEDHTSSRDDRRVLSLGEVDDDEAVIVTLTLHHMVGAIYLELDSDLHWVATLSERFDERTSTALNLTGFGNELLAASRLREYLQRRTDEYRLAAHKT